MPAGRPRKSKVIKILEGNLGRRDLGYNEPEGIGTPKMPAGLDSDAHSCWNAHIGQIVANGAGAGDSIRIAGMCQWYSRYVRISRIVDAGIGLPDYKAIIVCGLAWKNYEATASRFGISPVDRARLKTEAPKSSGDFDADSQKYA